MGTKPAFALAGLFVVGSLLSGCRSGPSAGGSGGSQMYGQAPSSYTTQSTVAGRTTTGMPAMQRTTPQADTVMGGAQPLPNATTFPSATTSSISAASPTPQYMGGNAFSSGPATSMPTGANYQMQPQNVQMQSPAVQGADDGMPRMPQTVGSTQAPRSFGSMPQQGYRTDQIQTLTPGGDQQYPGR